MNNKTTTVYWKPVGVRFHLINGSTTIIFKTMHDLELYCRERNLVPVQL